MVYSCDHLFFVVGQSVLQWPTEEIPATLAPSRLDLQHSALPSLLCVVL
jgi:hypothetical protein